MLAAKWRGLSDEYFDSLPQENQARILAAYRASQHLEAVQVHHPVGQKKRR